MTAIVTHKGDLIADRRHTHYAWPLTYTDERKIHISKDKQFAYGFAGESINSSNHVAKEKLARVIIEYMMVLEKDRIPFRKVIPKDTNIEPQEAVFITNSCQFVIVEVTSLDKYNIQRTNNLTLGAGGGSLQLAKLLMCGMDVSEAMALTSRYGSLTGPDADIIKASSLKNFVIKGVSL